MTATRIATTNRVSALSKACVANLMVLIDSPHSVSSENSDDEWNYFLDKRKEVGAPRAVRTGGDPRPIEEAAIHDSGGPCAARAVHNAASRAAPQPLAAARLSTGSGRTGWMSVGAHTFVLGRRRGGRAGAVRLSGSGRGWGVVDGGCGLVSTVERLGTLMAELAACSVAHLVEPDASRVHAALRAAQDAIGLVAAKVLGRIEADGRWATTTTGRGARDLDGWLAQESGGSRAGARRQTRLARAVSDETIPGLADAVTGGRVSLEHADVLTRLAPTSSLRKAALVGPDATGNAAYLLAKATSMGVEEFTKVVKRWAARIDPAADERGHRDAATKVTCTLAPRDDTVAMTAVMTSIDGAAFDAALTAVAGIPSIEDTRTHAQRMGAALGDMARLILDHGLAAGRSGGFRPHLTVTVSLDSLIAQVTATEARGSQSGEHALPELPAGWEPAVLADGTPIPASVLARLSCDSEVSRVVFGPASQVLDVGRAQRLYTGSLRRAVVARDRHCSYPGCDRPPARCEVHHVRSWAAGGETSLANGILLCWWHHEVVHTRRLRIHRNHTRARWDFHDADGTPIPHPGEREIARPDPGDHDGVGINEPPLFEVAS